MSFITIFGHLGADPEVRMTPNGNKVTRLRVATNIRRGKDKEEKTIWYRVDVWGNTHDKFISFLKKGSAVMIGGDLDPEIYTDKEGKPQLSLTIRAEMVRFSPFKSDKTEGQQRPVGSAAAPAPGRANMPSADLEAEFEESSNFAFATSMNSDEEKMPF